MSTFLTDDELNDDEDVKLFTKDKKVMVNNMITNFDSPCIILSKPDELDECKVKALARIGNFRFIVVEKPIVFESKISNNTVTMYSYDNINADIKMDLKIYEIMSKLKFRVNSKDAAIFKDVVKEAYKSSDLFYYLETIYKKLETKEYCANEIKRSVAQAVETMKNHIFETDLPQTFFHLEKGEKITPRLCIEFIIRYLRNN